MEPSRALLGSLASAAAAAQPGEDGAGAGAEEEEEEEEEAAAAPGDLGSDTPMPYWTAVFEYEAAGEDELTLRLGDVVEVLSKDSQVSGDEGWWTGQLNQRVGIFPSNYVTPRSAFSSRCQPGGEDPSCYSPIQWTANVRVEELCKFPEQELDFFNMLRSLLSEQSGANVP